MTNLRLPLHSLRDGTWFKLICGASFQHLPAIRSLTLAYVLAGADCIDIAADPAVAAAAREGMDAARALQDAARSRGFDPHPAPWLMVSLNDSEDPHFRKAEFDPNRCPPDCPRPCQRVCPADAIAFHEGDRGVDARRCYGCGRCLPVCPLGLISARSHVCTPEDIAPWLVDYDVRAIEIHTQPGQLAAFRQLWQRLEPWRDRLDQVAVSCTHSPDALEYLRSLSALIAPSFPEPIWQTDGRSMSGDLGKGTTKATLEFGRNVLSAGLPGYVQLAGGTNPHTIAKLKTTDLLNPVFYPNVPDPNATPSSDSLAYLAGVAYGSYARSLLAPVLSRLEARSWDSDPRLEHHPDLLWTAVEQARSLVALHKPQLSPMLP